ncbi:MAG: hypothetical protein GY750_10725 [Lentisphaerae bacterium]|nr:hypothetical protein [Lentisphaerota bacterium]MCP4101884.1 hypothetical protein [Lentisphaerota bacterium]
MRSLISKTLDHCRSDDSDFYDFKTGNTKGLVSKSLPQNLQHLLENPDDLFDMDNLFKNSTGTTAGPVTLGDKQYFLKRYNNRSLKHQVKNSLRLTRPFKVLATSAKIHQTGVFVPKVIAALEIKKAMVLDKSYLLTEMLTNIPTAAQHIEFIIKKIQEDAFTAGICESLARLHTAGIAHGDPKMTNLLVFQIGDHMDIGFLDLDGATLRDEPVPENIRIRELARVISSWLKTCRDLRLPHDKLNVLIAKYTKAYEEVCGKDLSSTRLNDRTEYLVKRVRKR